MSHVSSVTTYIKDIDAAKAACKRKGWIFHEGRTRARWFDRWVDDSPVPRHLFSEKEYQKIIAMSRPQRQEYMTAFLNKCDHVIEVPGASYDVALRKMDDGSYSVGFDWFGQQHLLKELGGTGADELMQAYAAEKVILEAHNLGHAIESEEVLENGDIRLTLLAAVR